MSKIELAREFVDRFCAGDIEGLESILREDLLFKGPLFQFGSRSEYLESLRNDPPRLGDCTILSITENPGEVSIYYDYGKEGAGLTIAQLFRFKGNKIAEILVVFDARGFG